MNGDCYSGEQVQLQNNETIEKCTVEKVGME